MRCFPRPDEGSGSHLKPSQGGLARGAMGPQQGKSPGSQPLKPKARGRSLPGGKCMSAPCSVQSHAGDGRRKGRGREPGRQRTEGGRAGEGGLYSLQSSEWEAIAKQPAGSRGNENTPPHKAVAPLTAGSQERPCGPTQRRCPEHARPAGASRLMPAWAGAWEPGVTASGRGVFLGARPCCEIDRLWRGLHDSMSNTAEPLNWPL